MGNVEWRDYGRFLGWSGLFIVCELIIAIIKQQRPDPDIIHITVLAGMFTVLAAIREARS